MSKEIQVCSSEDLSTMEDNTIVLLAYFISDNCVNTLMNFYLKKNPSKTRLNIFEEKIYEFFLQIKILPFSKCRLLCTEVKVKLLLKISL